MLLLRIHSYLKSVHVYTFLIWIPIIHTLITDVKKDVWGICGCFPKPKGVQEQKSLETLVVVVR
jgi:hypothetical protein